MLTRVAMIAVVLAAASITAVTAGGVKPLDPNAEEPLHQQISRATQRPRPAATTTTTTTNPAGAAEAAATATAAEAEQALLAEVDRKLGAIEAEVARLRALGESARPHADALDRR